MRQRSNLSETVGNQPWIDEDTREYVNIARELVGRQAYQIVVLILKSIIYLLVFMILCFVLGYDWIPRILAVFMMTSAGLRYCWHQWHGRGETVIRFPVNT
ncbi:hypothetical protein Ocin01_16352 [Orchesella cincta]|uniref:Uncharacterized protein n=1 Tax=Orchesella cincta TaxID=48709 RepID=A0A1D2MBI3_ORCCI|nr:hypothetical protein Ocin01_16352 [Orchesella cincta]